ncbi:hypothetical protein KAJ61_05785 [Candidatus Parcubacteria bacterium]|nr:hypothetical protein [Candidatus Parcubacteria bacterium]
MMKSEKQVELFQLIKKEFFEATDMEDYGNIDFAFEINQSQTNDNNLVVDVEIKWREVKSFFIKISVDVNKNFLVCSAEDFWEKWTSFDYSVRNLFLVILFEALDENI